MDESKKIKELETAVNEKDMAKISELRTELKAQGIEFKINEKEGLVVYRMTNNS